MVGDEYDMLSAAPFCSLVSRQSCHVKIIKLSVCARGIFLPQNHWTATMGYNMLKTIKRVHFHPIDTHDHIATSNIFL